jgi:hypothetical protein
VPTNVADPADPIWNGVTLLLNDTQAPNLFAMASGNWFVQNGNPLRSGISVVASNPADSTMILIAYAEPGALSATSGPRYYINWGSDNTTMNYNDDGKKVFLNAIAVLTGGFAPDGPIPLKITKNPNTPGTFDFEWPSRSGKLYDLLTSTDLADPVAEWPVYDDGQTLYEAIPPAGETTTLAAVPSADPRRFFAIREFDSLPPPPLLFSDFEDGDGGFTVTTTAGTAWVWGAPNSNDNGGTPNPGGSVTAGNSGSLKCWGSGIGNPGFYLVPTSSTLSSPVIDLTEVGAAELSFHEALDLETNDTARVFLVNADTGADIGGAIHTAIDTANSTAQWAKVSPINISAGAGHRVRIEWRFNGQGSSADYLGWYIDDVMVIATP